MNKRQKKKFKKKGLRKRVAKYVYLYKVYFDELGIAHCKLTEKQKIYFY